MTELRKESIFSFLMNYILVGMGIGLGLPFGYYIMTQLFWLSDVVRHLVVHHTPV